MFGQTLTNKAKHSTVVYALGHDNTVRYHNKPNFKCSRVINSDFNLYEIELMKKKLVHDPPIQLGKMILDMAKNQNATMGL